MENKTEKKTIRAPLFIIAAMLESAAVATDPSAKREILKAVNLTSDAAGEKLTATATDSARLNRITYDLALDAENNNKEIKASANFSINLAPSSVNKIISLNKEAEKETKKTAKSDLKYFILANIETDGNAATITTENANGETVASAKLETICGSYPVTENIFPQNKGAFLSFSPSFIGDLKKAAKALKGNGNAVTMQAPAAPFRPFVCEYQSGIPQLEAVALITPFRCNGGNYPGFDYLTSGGAAVTEYTNKIQLLESRLSHMEEERDDLKAELQKALRTEDKPAAANSADLEFMREKLQATEKRLKDAEKLADELTAKNRSLITETAALTADNGEKAARVADLEEKYKAAAAFKERTEKLKAKQEELKKIGFTLKGAQLAYCQNRLSDYLENGHGLRRIIKLESNHILTVEIFYTSEYKQFKEHKNIICEIQEGEEENGFIKSGAGFMLWRYVLEELEEGARRDVKGLEKYAKIWASNPTYNARIIALYNAYKEGKIEAKTRGWMDQGNELNDEQAREFLKNWKPEDQQEKPTAKEEQEQAPKAPEQKEKEEPTTPAPYLSIKGEQLYLF